MNTVKNKPPESNANAPHENQPEALAGSLGDETRRQAYLVRANVHLACAAEFLVNAVDSKAAEAIAKQILNEEDFKVIQESATRPERIWVSVPDYCTDTEMISVEPFSTDHILDASAVRADLEFKLGKALAGVIEELPAGERSEERIVEAIRNGCLVELLKGLQVDLSRIKSASSEHARNTD